MVKENLLSAKQLNCDAAKLWGSPGPGHSPARQFGSASCWSALLCSWEAPVSSTKETVFILQWKGKVPSWSQRGAHLYRQESPRLVPDWSVLMQIRAPNFSLVQKALFYLVWIELPWLVHKNGEIAEQLWLDGESLSLIGWNRIPGTPL